MHDVKIIGLFGLCGLMGLCAIWRPVPARRAGGAVRAIGLAGLLGLAGFWNPWLGACGALGAFSLWNHPSSGLRRLAWMGFAAPLGLAIGVLLLRVG